MRRASPTTALTLGAGVLALCLGAPAGCSYSVTSRLHIEIDEATVIPEGGTLLVKVYYRIEPTPVDDRNGDGIPDDIERGSGPEASIGLASDERFYFYEDTSANETPVWAIAFIDLNDNGLLDDGEPFAGEQAPAARGCENETWNAELLVGGAFAAGDSGAEEEEV